MCIGVCSLKNLLLASLFPGGDLHYHLTQHGVFSEDEVSVCVMHCVSSCSQHLYAIYLLVYVCMQMFCR